MFCREAKLVTSSYLDRQLDHQTVRLYEEHVLQCADCRDHLDLLKQIPVALQTDRMLAPKPEFTTLVMQRIIVKQQFGNTSSTFEAQFSSLSYSGTVQDGDDDYETDDEDEEDTDEDDLAPAQVQPISMADFARHRQANRAGRLASNYVLRFSSVAAALVMMVGVSLYALGNFSSTPVDAPTAAVYGSIKDFADNLRNALSSPLELVAGIAISAVILVSLWYLLRTVRADDELNSRSNQNAEADTRR